MEVMFDVTVAWRGVGKLRVERYGDYEPRGVQIKGEKPPNKGGKVGVF